MPLVIPSPRSALGSFALLLAGLLLSGICLCTGYAAPGRPLRLNNPLPTDGYVSSYLMSSNNSRIVYLVKQPVSGYSQGALYSVDWSGANTAILSPQTAPAKTASTYCSTVDSYRISPDGKQLVYAIASCSATTSPYAGLYSVAITGGTPVFLASGADFHISPDSTSVVYIGADQKTAIVPILGGTIVTLVDEAVQDIAFTPDSQSLIFRQEGKNGLYSISCSGGTPKQFATTISASYTTEASPLSDNDRVLLHSTTTNGSTFTAGNLHTARISSKTVVQLDNFSTGDRFVTSFGITPDESRAIFTATYGSTSNTTDKGLDLFSIPLSGGTPLQLTLSLNHYITNYAANGLPWTISPDGSYVVYTARRTGMYVSELYRVKPTGGTPVILGTGVTDTEPLISPDSSRIVQLGDLDKDGISTLYSFSLKTNAAPIQLNSFAASSRSVKDKRITPDSKNLVFLADLNNDEVHEAFIVPLSGGTPARVNATLPSGGDVSSFALSTDSKYALYLADQNTNDIPELFRVELDKAVSATPFPISTLSLLLKGKK